MTHGEMSTPCLEKTSRSLKRSLSDNVCDPGGFGRALRAREHMERFNQDTGFYGLHLGWERGTSPDMSHSQSYGHQWRLQMSDMGALDFSQPFASTLNGMLVTREPCTESKDVSSSSKPGTEEADPMMRQKNEIEVAPVVYSPLWPAAKTYKPPSRMNSS